MSEDPNKNLPPQSFEERVLAEFARLNTRLDGLEKRLDGFEERLNRLEKRFDGFDARLTTLEEKVDERLRETRPIWEGVLQRLAAIETALDTLNRQFKTMIRDMFDLRSRIEKLEDEQPTT